MSLSKYFYDPFHEPFYTISDFNRLFDAAWEARPSNSGREVQRNDGAVSGGLRPRMDLHESKDKNEVTASFELPGMKKEDISIDVHNSRIIVSGQSVISNTLDNDGYAVRERRFGRFTRTVPIPAGTRPEEIKASMDDGILTIKFPRTQPEQEAKKITIS